jgi:hypothetical protein
VVSRLLGLHISAGFSRIRNSSRLVLSDLLKVLFHEFVVGLKLLLMFIISYCKVDEVSICAELRQGLEPL